MILLDKPVLVIMAAGMGSRYGGLKQIDPIDKQGQIIIDYSIYDAKQAGFEKIIFIIKKENAEEFEEVIGKRISQHVDVEYVYQDIENIPSEYEVPKERIKPWGTAHAVLSCIDNINGPFAVINADDFYGKEAYATIYQYLTTHQDNDKYRYAMVGYELKNTVTDHGYVARGVCEVNEDNHLVDIVERVRIEKRDNKIVYVEDSRVQLLDSSTIVSMNIWGFSKSILLELKNEFTTFLDEHLKINPLKCEYFLPFVVNKLIQDEKATVHVLKSKDKWYGVTYKEDKEIVVEAIQKMKDNHLYPEYLWK